MTPYRGAATSEQNSYNRYLTRESVIIEMCFGRLKQRFPMLHHKIRVKTEKISYVILSCFILHNMLQNTSTTKISRFWNISTTKMCFPACRLW
nr:unnamed protein product [Callosobruchus analis]